MTRINTNVSSLNAQKTLARSNAQLQESLTRLSTGLRINVGKDDPAGLIASEILRSDIVSTQKAISNSDRANQMIATADSALGQVSSLLNDVRGLVEEAANKGAMSQEQITANQLQIDSSLEAIDRISQTTQFQGRRLLDGSLDFITQDTDISKMTALSVDKANFGTLPEIGVNVQVVDQAKQAQLSYKSNQTSDKVVLEVGGSDGFETFTFDAGSSVSQIANAINLVSDALGVQANQGVRTATAAMAGQTKVTNVGGNNGVTMTAVTAGRVAGDFTLQYIKDSTVADGNNAVTAWKAGSPNVLQVRLDVEAGTKAGNGGAVAVGGNGSLTLDADKTGAEFNNVKLVIVDNTTPANENATYDYNTNTITATIDVANSNANGLAALINNSLGSVFTAVGSDANDTIGAGTYSSFTDGNGVTAGTMKTTLQNLTDAINNQAASNAVLSGALITGSTGTQAVQVVTQSGSIGDVNSGDANDPNNRIQLTTTGGAANMAVEFQAAGPNQTFGVNFVENTRTNGKSTAYIQGTAAVLKVESNRQGAEYDGITVTLHDSATDKSVVWDANAKTLDVYGDIASGNDTADTIATRITASGLFTATALADGNVADGANGITADGARYDKVIVNLGTDANGTVTTTAKEVVDYINASPTFSALGIGAANVTTSTGAGVAATGTLTLSEEGKTATNAYAQGTTYATDGANGQLSVTAKVAGASLNNVKMVFTNDSAVTAAGEEFATYDAAQKLLTFHIKDGTSTANSLATAISTGSGTSLDVKNMFTVAAAGAGTSHVHTTDVGWLRNGVTYTGTSLGGVGSQGNYDKGDAVGTSGLEFKSTKYGSDQFVSIKALSGTFNVLDTSNVAKDRVIGTDAKVRINGIGAVTHGLDVSLNTATLALNFSLTTVALAGETMNFRITGGGAQFQIGPDVVSQQQTRIGITSMNTARLGGNAGKLYEIRSGGAKALSGDIINGAKVVEQVITQVTTLRGRLGAFQRTTLDTNINALNDSLEALTNAESSIRDSDFAKESAGLTRAQILVQSGLSVLGIANSRPQSVLALLRQ